MAVPALSAGRVKCAFCRRGLLGTAEVYRQEETGNGMPGAPVLITTVRGCFYRKGERHAAEVIAVAGEIGRTVETDCRLLVFDNAGAEGNLVRVDGGWYRLTRIRPVASLCLLWELEVYPYADLD